MRHLHPMTWLVSVIGLAVAVALADNPLVTLVVIVCAVTIAVARRSPRATAFTAAVEFGAMLGVVVLVIGLFTGPESPGATALFTVPSPPLGAGAALGGSYTGYRLVATALQALKVLAYCTLLGVLWQACPAGQWCDLAETLLGRGALLLAPMLCLGEAISRTRADGHWYRHMTATTIDHDTDIVSSWHRHTRHHPATALSAAVAGITVALVVLLLVAATMLGGVPLTFGSHTAVVTGPALLVIITVLWFLLRLSVGGVSLVPPLTAVDRLTGLIGLCPVLAAAADTVTGDVTAFSTPAGSWPALPPVTTLAVVASTVACVLGTVATARRRRTAGARHA